MFHNKFVTGIIFNQKRLFSSPVFDVFTILIESKLNRNKINQKYLSKHQIVQFWLALLFFRLSKVFRLLGVTNNN